MCREGPRVRRLLTAALMVAVAIAARAQPADDIRIRPSIQFGELPSNPFPRARSNAAGRTAVGPPQRLGQPPPAGPEVRPEDILRLFFPPRPYGDAGPGGNRSLPPRPRRAATLGVEALPVPSVEQLAGFSYDELRKRMREALERLETALDGISTGPGWKRHLEIETLRRAVAKDQTAPPDAATRALLRKIANRFEKVSGQPKYRRISELLGFRTLQRGLAELALEPAARWQRQLGTHADTFDDALSGIGTGPGWKKYLQVDALKSIRGSPDQVPPEELEILKKILARFDEVTRNRKYQTVARLHGFAPAHRALKQYLGRMRAVQALNDQPKPDPMGTVILAPEPRRSETETVTLMPLPVPGEPEEVTVMPLPIRGEPEEVTVMPLPVRGEPEEVTVMPLPVRGEPEEVTVMPLPVRGEPEEVTVMPLPIRGEPEEVAVMRLPGAEDRLKLAMVPPTWRLQSDLCTTLVPPPRPEGLSAADSAALDGMVRQARAGEMEHLKNTWSEFLRKSKAAPDHSRVEALVQTVLAETRAALLAELKERAEKLHHIQQVRKTLAEHLAELESIHEDLDADARVQLEILEKVSDFHPGWKSYTIWQQRLLTRNEVEDRIARLEGMLQASGDDAQLAHVDLESMLQKQQEILELMPSVSKTLHDAATAVIRKL